MGIDVSNVVKLLSQSGYYACIVLSKYQNFSTLSIIEAFSYSKKERDEEERKDETKLIMRTLLFAFFLWWCEMLGQW